MKFATGKCRRFREFKADIAALTEATKILKERAGERNPRSVELADCNFRRLRRRPRRFSHWKISMKLDFVPFPSFHLPALFKSLRAFRAWLCHFAVDHHRAAFAVTQTSCRATWRPDLETKSILSRLAHHRRHRLRQNHLPASINWRIRFFKMRTNGAACALMKKASIGKRFRQWRGTTHAKTI